jgi:hypothetical protein
MKFSVLPIIVMLGYYTTSNGMMEFTCKTQDSQTHLINLQTERDRSFGRGSIRGQLLVLAVLKGNNDRVQEILQGISDEKINKIMENEFKDNVHLLHYLLSRKLSGDPYPYDEAALMCASQYGYVDIIKQLLACNANIDAQCDYYLCTSLMCATGNGHPDAVRLLIQKGANLKIRDREQKTALDHARELNQLEIVKLLEEAEFEEAKTEQSWQQNYAGQNNLPD